MRGWSAGVGFAGAWLVLACAGCGSTGTGSGKSHGNPEGTDSGADAGDAFGNAAGHSAQTPALMLIDDGGAGLLPDGAIVYLALWARPCPPGSTLSYENFGRDFFQTYCLRCHSAQRAYRDGAPEGVNFDTLDGIAARKDKIWALAADENALMPAAGATPSSGERHMLGDWLACGAAP